MFILVEGMECPEGSSKIAIELKHGKLDHEVKPSDGNASPKLYEDGELLAEGTLNCLRAVEDRRRKRVLSKTDSPLIKNAAQLIAAT